MCTLWNDAQCGIWLCLHDYVYMIMCWSHCLVINRGADSLAWKIGQMCQCKKKKKKISHTVIFVWPHQATDSRVVKAQTTCARVQFPSRSRHLLRVTPQHSVPISCLPSLKHNKTPKKIELCCIQRCRRIWNWRQWRQIIVINGSHNSVLCCPCFHQDVLVQLQHHVEVGDQQ